MVKGTPQKMLEYLLTLDIAPGGRDAAIDGEREERKRRLFYFFLFLQNPLPAISFSLILPSFLSENSVMDSYSVTIVRPHLLHHL